MLSLQSVATEARRIGVERPVFEEAVRESSGFAARADDDERFAAECRNVLGSPSIGLPRQRGAAPIPPPHLRPGGNKTRRADSRARTEPSTTSRRPSRRRGCSPARKRRRENATDDRRRSRRPRHRAPDTPSAIPGAGRIGVRAQLRASPSSAKVPTTMPVSAWVQCLSSPRSAASRSVVDASCVFTVSMNAPNQS